MKKAKVKYCILILSLIFVTACGNDNGGGSQGACAGLPGLGVWHNSGTTLTLGENCSGSDTGCAASFTFTRPTTQGGQSLITIISNNGAPNCLSRGPHTCTQASDGRLLAINCGGSTITYTR